MRCLLIFSFPTGYELVEGITTEVSISEISDTEQINE